MANKTVLEKLNNNDPELMQELEEMALKYEKEKENQKEVVKHEKEN